MYPVSQDVINLFKANQYQQAKVEVFTPAANVLEPVNGVSATPDLTIGSDRVLQNGLVVDRYCVTGEKLEIGTAIAAELTLKLNNHDGYFDDTVFKGKWLKAQVGIKDWSNAAAAITWIPLGWFVVDSAPRKLSTITVSALDFMTLADVVSTPRQISAFATFLKYQNLGHALEQETFGSALAPYKTVIDSALQERANGFTSDFLPLPGAGNNDIIGGTPVAATWLSNLGEGERTRRQSVIWAAQILGACAYIDCDGALRFGWCQDSGVTITPAERYSSDMAEEDVILTGVSYTEYAEQTESEGDETVEYESDKTYLAGNTTGLVLDITNNPFVKGKDIESFLSGLYDQIAGTAYRPFEATVKPCPYLWPMDKVTYVDASGVSHSTIITNITYTINAPTSIAARGDSGETDGTSTTNSNSGRVNSAANADNADKLDGLTAGKRWGSIPYIEVDGVMEVGKYLDFHEEDNASSTDYDARITCDGGIIIIPKLAVDKITDRKYSTTTYTSFSGGVVSSGSVVVTKKLGVCYISGSITASKSITDWTTILTSSQVPAPQHGKMIPFNVPAWGSSYTAALRGRIPASGGLQIRLGAAREYVFEISYPIN